MGVTLKYPDVEIENIRVTKNAYLQGNVHMDQVNLNVDAIHHARKLRVRDLKSRSARSDDMVVYDSAKVHGTLAARVVDVGNNLIVRGDLQVVGNMIRNEFINIVDVTTSNVTTGNIFVTGEGIFGGQATFASNVVCGKSLFVQTLDVANSMRCPEITCDALTAQDGVFHGPVTSDSVTTSGALQARSVLSSTSILGADVQASNALRGATLRVDGTAVIHGDLLVPNGVVQQKSMKLASLDVSGGSIIAADIGVQRDLNVLMQATVGSLRCTRNAIIGGDLQVNGQLKAPNRSFDTLYVANLSSMHFVSGEITCSSLRVLGGNVVLDGNSGSGSADEAQITANVVANIVAYHVPSIVSNISQTISENLPDLSEQVFLFEISQSEFANPDVYSPYQFVAPFKMLLTAPPRASARRVLGASEIALTITNNGTNIFSDPTENLIIPEGAISGSTQAALSESARYVEEGNLISIDFQTAVVDSRFLKTYFLYKRAI